MTWCTVSTSFSSVQFSSVQFSSVQFSSVQFSSVQSSVQFQFSSVPVRCVLSSFFDHYIQSSVHGGSVQEGCGGANKALLSPGRRERHTVRPITSSSVNISLSNYNVIFSRLAPQSWPSQLIEFAVVYNVFYCHAKKKREGGGWWRRRLITVYPTLHSTCVWCHSGVNVYIHTVNTNKDWGQNRNSMMPAFKALVDALLVLVAFAGGSKVSESV